MKHLQKRNILHLNLIVSGDTLAPPPPPNFQAPLPPLASLAQLAPPTNFIPAPPLLGKLCMYYYSIKLIICKFSQFKACGLVSRIRDMEAEWRLRVITDKNFLVNLW